VSARAAVDGTVRFVAVGDTGMGNDGQRAVASAMARACAARGCDFVITLGDNFYPTGIEGPDDPQWREKFEEPYAALRMPFWISLGNHDYGNGGRGDDFGKAAHQIAYAQRSPKWKLPANHYRFSHGPAEFFALDTNLARFLRDGDQKRHVTEWVAASRARWKIAFGHHPYLSNGPHGNVGDYDPRHRYAHTLGFAVWKGHGVKALLEEAVCGKADLYLSGHDHSRQWLQGTCAGTELAISGAGAEGTGLRGNNPARFQSSALGFLYVAVSGHELVAEFIDAAGKVDFERRLTRP